MADPECATCQRCLRSFTRRAGNPNKFCSVKCKCEQQKSTSLSRKFPGESKSWQAMRSRCLNPNHDAYYRYGGRGITICDRWSDFARFVEDMGRRPPGMTLDRKDNDCGYSPDNCRWATPKEQARDKRTLLTAKGMTLSITDWSATTGVKESTIRKRILSMSVEDAIFGHIEPRKPRKVA